MRFCSLPHLITLLVLTSPCLGAFKFFWTDIFPIVWKEWVIKLPASAAFLFGTAHFGYIEDYQGGHKRSESNVALDYDPSGVVPRTISANTLPPGVPAFVLNQCVIEVGAAVKKGQASAPVITAPWRTPEGHPNGVLFNKIPATCMTLLTVLLGNGVDGPRPTPRGSDSFSYDALTADQYNDLREFFVAHGATG